MGDTVRPVLHGAWISGAALAAAAAGALAVLPRFGYATPFGVPDRISFRGRDYIGPACAKPARGDLPLRRVGSVPGVLTGAKPIFLPDRVPHGLDPTYVYLRAGCLRAYDLSGGP